MASLSDFSQEEQKLLRDAPHWVYEVMKKADGAHPLDRGAVEIVRESRAFKKSLTGHISDANLVKEVQNAVPQKGEVKADFDTALRQLGQIADLVDAKAAEDASEFKSFLFRLSEAVAEASGDKLFGLGQKVSEAEVETMNKIKSALKMG